MDEMDRLWHMRNMALQRGDAALAAEIALQMEHLGIPLSAPQLDDTPVMKERAVSHTPPVKRGKQR